MFMKKLLIESRIRNIGILRNSLCYKKACFFFRTNQNWDAHAYVIIFLYLSNVIYLQNEISL